MLGHLRKVVNDFMLRNIGAWLLAVLVTYATAALAATQSVIARLADMGVAVSLADRLRTTGQDLVGMAPMFAPMIAVAFLVAFPIAALVLRWRPHWRWFGYPLAGGVALLVLHLALEAALNIVPVAVARTVLGLAVQVVCGALGGWVFLRLSPAPTTR
jgi:hypothetical protein